MLQKSRGQAPCTPIKHGAIHPRPETQAYTLAEANQALMELKEGNVRGAKVLVL